MHNVAASVRKGVLLGLLLLLLAPTAGCQAHKGGATAQAADDAEKLAALELGTFYFLGEEDFDSYTCAVRSDMLDLLVENLKRQLGEGVGAVTVKESLSAFHLTFTKSDDTLRFVRPQLEVTVTDPSKVKDQAGVEQGLARVHAGFITAVDGAIGLLEAFFDDLQISALSKRSEVKLTLTRKGYQASYSSEDEQVQVEFDGTTKRFETTVGEQPWLVVLSYTDFPGRGLVLTSGEIKAGSDYEISMSAQYGIVDNLLVPTEHAVAQKQLVGDKWISNVMNFQMTDCRVTR